MPDEFAHFGSAHQRRHGVRLIRAAIEPALEIIGADRDGYARVKHGEVGARRRRDNRDGVDLLAVRSDPGLRDTCKPDRTAVAAIDEIWLLAAAERSPLIIAVGRN